MLLHLSQDSGFVGFSLKSALYCALNCSGVMLNLGSSLWIVSGANILPRL